MRSQPYRATGTRHVENLSCLQRQARKQPCERGRLPHTSFLQEVPLHVEGQVIVEPAGPRRLGTRQCQRETAPHDQFRVPVSRSRRRVQGYGRTRIIEWRLDQTLPGPADLIL